MSDAQDGGTGVLTPREVVADIRSKWGVEESQDGTGPSRLHNGSQQQQQVVSFLHEALQRALTTLAQDIYKSETHFLLELIQNADDNRYDDGVVPGLEVHMMGEAGSIVLLNNELGFSERDVRALCNIGDSTKKMALGYIGEKGIGWKSVFMVTHAPALVSNGYAFRFQARVPTSGADADAQVGLGFVVPEWIDSPETALALPAPVGLVEPATGGLTTIALPLTAAFAGPDAMADLFGELDRSIGHTLLLFLRKLRTLTLVVDGTVRVFTRTTAQDALAYAADKVLDEGDHAGGVVTITECRDRAESSGGSVEHEFLVYKRILVPPASAKEEKRATVGLSEMVVAFRRASLARGAELAAEPLYAFLPVRSYGFPFLIQADFLVAADREDLKGGPWNGWLMDKLVPTVVEALGFFRDSDEVAAESAGLLLRLLPAPTRGASSTIDPLFAPLIPRMYDLLRGTECVLTTMGTWARPGDCVLPSGAARRIAPSSLLMQLCGVQYVAEPIAAAAAEDARFAEVLRGLGVQTFDAGLFLRFGAGLGAKTLRRTLASHGVEDEAEWFAAVYEYLADEGVEAGPLKKADVPLFPMAGSGAVLTLRQVSGSSTVFAPLVDEDDGATAVVGESLLRLARGDTKFRLLDDGAFKVLSEDSLVSARVRAYLSVLGVQPPTPASVLKHHVVVGLERAERARERTGRIPNMRHEVMVALGSFALEFYHVADPGVQTRLAQAMLLRADAPRSELYFTPSSLYLGAPYTGTAHLEELFYGCGANVAFVSPVYLEAAALSASALVDVLRGVFGVHEAPALISKPVVVTGKTAKARYGWGSVHPKTRYEVTDYELSVEFLLAARANARGVMRLLDDVVGAETTGDGSTGLWALYYGPRLTSVARKDLKTGTTRTVTGYETRALGQLKSALTVATSMGDRAVEDAFQLGEGKGLDIPAVIAHVMPVLETPIASAGLRDALGVSSQLDVAGVLKVLDGLAQRVDDPVYEGGLPLFAALYKMLSSGATAAQLSEVEAWFQDGARVFVPVEEAGTGVRGEWLLSSEVYWSSAAVHSTQAQYSDALTQPYLEDFYDASLRKLFVNVARVPESPPVGATASVISKLVGKYSGVFYAFDPPSDYNLLRQLYGLMSRMLRDAAVSPSASEPVGWIHELLASTPVFVVSATDEEERTFYSFVHGSHALANDAPELAELFVGVSLPTLALSAGDLGTLAPLLREAGVRSLAGSLSIAVYNGAGAGESAAGEHTPAALAWTERLMGLLPHLVQYCYHAIAARDQWEFELDPLRVGLQVVSVPGLQAQYYFTADASMRSLPTRTSLLLHRGTLYFDPDAHDLCDDAFAMQFAEFLFKGVLASEPLTSSDKAGIVSFLSLLLMRSRDGEGAVKAFMALRGFPVYSRQVQARRGSRRAGGGRGRGGGARADRLRERRRGSAKAAGPSSSSGGGSGSGAGPAVSVETVMQNLVALVQSRGEGVAAAEIPSAYTTAYGVSLDPGALGFRSLSALLKALPRDGVSVVSKGGMRVYPSGAVLPEGASVVNGRGGGRGGGGGGRGRGGRGRGRGGGGRGGGRRRRRG